VRVQILPEKSFRVLCEQPEFFLKFSGQEKFFHENGFDARGHKQTK